MIGDVSLLSGHVVTSLSRFVAFLLSVGVRSQDVELFAAHSLRAGGATAAALSYLILSYLNNLITWMYNFKT